MGEVRISDLSQKAVVSATDEFEIQEAGGGDSKKVSAGDLFSFLIAARGRSDATGVLAPGSVNITSVTKTATGIYLYDIGTNIQRGATQVFVTSQLDGHVAVARVYGTSNQILVSTYAWSSNAATAADADHSLLALN